MSHARYIVGDVFGVLATLEDGSVDLVLTSPPFLALRSYLPADHPDKAKEIGSESTPAAFLDTLLHLTAEWRRVLAPHGSICVELGDTYAGSGGAGGDYGEGGLREGQPAWIPQRARTVALDSHPDSGSDAATIAPSGSPRSSIESRAGVDAKNRGNTSRGTSAGGEWPLAKSLCGIPHLYHLSLAYGRNLLTGEPSPAGQWRVRNVVAWCRPNPPVGALGDKFRPATSYMTVATVARDRYFDLDAVRTPGNSHDRDGERKGRLSAARDVPDQSGSAWMDDKPLIHHEAGAPPLDWWEIPTQPYAGAHYATWPMALCERPIKSMCPQRVCRVCGEPSRRIVDAVRDTTLRPGPSLADAAAKPGNGLVASHGETTYTTLGWTTCGHDDWRNGLVLDPFAGSGTTLAVATGHGRDAIGIDLDDRNADLAQQRVGMFLDVELPQVPEEVA